MEILLVPSFDISRGRLQKYVPYGLLALQSIAQKFATKVSIWDRSLSEAPATSVDEFLETVAEAINPGAFDVVGLSVVTSSFLYTSRLAEKIRKLAPRTLILFGGPFVTRMPREILDWCPSVDAVFVGEAERSFSEFLGRCDLGSLDVTNIAGVATRSSMFRSPPAIDDLDELPRIASAPDFLDRFRDRHPTVNEWTAIPLEATRGCPLQCSFCSTRQVWGARVRRKSVRRLVEEMSELSAICGSSFFNLIGDNVGVPRAPFLEFCDELAAVNPGFTWGCALKLDRLEPDHLIRMWKAGMRAMFVGLESSNQVTLNQVRKKTNINKEIDNVNAAIDMGYRVTTSFIIGFPWETLDDIRDTYALHCKLIKRGVDKSQVNILCPIPGTDIVAEGEIVFDEWWLSATSDGIASTSDMAEAARLNPALFSHLGRYVTPRIESKALVATRRHAEAFMALHRAHRRSANSNWNRF